MDLCECVCVCVFYSSYCTQKQWFFGKNDVLESLEETFDFNRGDMVQSANPFKNSLARDQIESRRLFKYYQNIVQGGSQKLLLTTKESICISCWLESNLYNSMFDDSYSDFDRICQNFTQSSH